MSEVTTIFDITQSGYGNWWLLIPGAGCFIVGILILRFRNVLGIQALVSPYVGPKAAGTFFAIVGACGFVLALVVTFQMHYDARQALRTHHYLVAEGKLADFQPGGCGGSDTPQTFTVSGTHFQIDCPSSTWFQGFGFSSTPGVPDPSGLNVRISYINATPLLILRVEVQEH